MAIQDDVETPPTGRKGKPQKRREPKRFTRDFIKRSYQRIQTRPAGDEVIWDAAFPRFGIRLKGKRLTFIIQYRVRHLSGLESESRRLWLGAYPAWDLETARDKAGELLRLADSGTCPKQQRIEAETAITVGQLADEYWGKIQAGKIVRKNGEKHSSETIRTEKFRITHIKEAFGDKRARELTQRDVEAAKNRWIEENKGAKRTLVSLGALLSYGERHYADVVNVARAENFT